MCASDTQANYALEDGFVRVTNRCRKPDGAVEEANGRANVVEGSANARLRVSFFRPFYGDYWVLAIDPEYQWVLIGEPSRKYGWVLARKSQMNEDELDRILAIAASRGFDRGAFQRTPQTKPIS
jgi:apolipoprotein D and lipocalin family protein